MAHRFEQAPGKRFCAQCGERRIAEEERSTERRCADCARCVVAEERFSTETGARLRPPPPLPRTTLASYLSSDSGYRIPYSDGWTEGYGPSGR